MIQQTKTFLALTICSALAATVLSGCAAQNQKTAKVPAARTHASPDDTSFAAGVGRAPTPETTYAFAKILIAQGRDREALYVLGKVMQEHPKFIPAYNETAGVYVRSDRLADAIRVIESGLKLAPHDCVLHNNLGMCHLLDSHYEPALTAFTRATEIMPSNPTFRANRAAALALLGRDKEAEAEYRTVLGTGPTRDNLKILDRARASKFDEETTKQLAAPQSTPKPTPTDATGDARDSGDEDTDFTGGEITGG